MLVLTRTTKPIVYNKKTLSDSFTQVLPIFTEQQADEAMEELIKNRVIQRKTTWFASDDWSSNAQKYFPEGAGEYEYKFVASPNTKKQIMILIRTGFNDYYNDEYTRSGDCEFYAGPYESTEAARSAAMALMDDFVYDGWCEENEVKDADLYEHHGEGDYTMASIVEIDVIA